MTGEALGPAADAARGERIAKWLSRAGVASRRDAEKLLADGKVRLNNRAVTHPATFVQPGDTVQVSGRRGERPCPPGCRGWCRWGGSTSTARGCCC